jgi:hypothetical protein
MSAEIIEAVETIAKSEGHLPIKISSRGGHIISASPFTAGVGGEDPLVPHENENEDIVSKAYEAEETENYDQESYEVEQTADEKSYDVEQYDAEETENYDHESYEAEQTADEESYDVEQTEDEELSHQDETGADVVRMADEAEETENYDQDSFGDDYDRYLPEEAPNELEPSARRSQRIRRAPKILEPTIHGQSYDTTIRGSTHAQLEAAANI